MIKKRFRSEIGIKGSNKESRAKYGLVILLLATIPSISFSLFQGVNAQLDLPTVDEIMNSDDLVLPSLGDIEKSADSELDLPTSEELQYQADSELDLPTSEELQYQADSELDLPSLDEILR